MIPAWVEQPPGEPDQRAGDAARARQAELTKPPGSLGRLEQLAIRIAALQGTSLPSVERVQIAVFAADHGIADEGVSAFPQAVTGEMVRNFARGGAAINVLAHQLGATLEVIDVGTVSDPGELPGVIPARVASGTANFRRQAAMTPEQLAAALNAGRAAAERAVAANAQLFIGGEMGIANTTSASAVAVALLGAAPADLVGPGTGLDTAGVRHKAEVIQAALDHHALNGDALSVLAAVGGFEIAALSGAFMTCGQRRLPILVDGFIASVAALVALRQVPALAPWLIPAHRSAEPGHDRVLAALDLEPPLLDLGMRLGEGSGAATAVPLLRTACALHAGMATFADAAISR